VTHSFRFRWWGFQCHYSVARRYSSDRWERLRDDLLEAARTEDAVAVDASEHGTRYRIRCRHSGARELPSVVDSIWLVASDGRPRIITAYPAGRS
jgi:hypothetical protein